MIKFIFRFIDIFFSVYLIVYATFLLLSVSIGSISLYEQKRRQRLYNYIDHDYYIPVSIIVPAYNEGITVVDTVQSLLDQDYKLYEIIVVDDGSTDDTAQKLIEHFDLKKIQRPIRKKIPCMPEKSIYVSYNQKVTITLIQKINGGKADALNMGINTSDFPYFICMDADSVLQFDALKNIVCPVLEESNVVAVGGLIRIVNDVTLSHGKVVDYRMPKKMLVSMQVLEYDRSFLASRLFFDKFNGNLIISGAFGLFKKSVVIEVGGYSKETVGEDMELVVRLHAFCRANHVPYKIKYSANAICWSQVPNNLADLRKQRQRWHIGLFQSINAHKQILFNPVYGALAFISFMYFLIYELLSPYIEVFGIICTIVAIYFNLINLRYMITIMSIYVVFSGIMSLAAFFARVHSMSIKIHFADIIKAISLCLVENVFLRLILSYTRLTALIGYKNKKNFWGEITREKIKTKSFEDKL